MKSYDYKNRQGIEEISWARFSKMTVHLAEALADRGVDIILGIARAGLFPATAVSLALRRELYPVRVTRRVDDVVRFERPVWRVDVPTIVAGQRVAVIDEVADTGETLALVAARAMERGSQEAITACLVAHSWADPTPDAAVLMSDALIVFPWDRKVLLDGKWQVHPEIQAARRLQKKQSDHPEPDSRGK